MTGSFREEGPEGQRGKAAVDGVVAWEDGLLREERSLERAQSHDGAKRFRTGFREHAVLPLETDRQFDVLAIPASPARTGLIVSDWCSQADPGDGVGAGPSPGTQMY